MSTGRKLPRYMVVDGFRLPGGFFPDAFRDTVKYRCRDDDVFLVTYPKCGTTWMHYIIYLIYHKGEPITTAERLRVAMPFPEATGIESVLTMSRPGAIKTHLPFHLQPYSPKTKYIALTRNPKDCCISFYHHTERMVSIYNFKDGDFADYFDLFMDGLVDYGDYFDHVQSWYEHRNDPNVLFLTYEETKADTAGVVARVAAFLGKEYAGMLESDAGLADRIVRSSSLKVMKETTSEMNRETMKTSPDPSAMSPAVRHIFEQAVKVGDTSGITDIFRKGIVGDWRTVLTPEQSRCMDKKMEMKLGSTELLKYWKEIGAV